MDSKEVANIYNYSFKNNVKILEKIINVVNKEALKNPKYMCVFSIGIEKSLEISKFISSIKRSPNFFLLFAGIEKSKKYF